MRYASDLSSPLLNGSLALDAAYEEAPIHKERASSYAARFEHLKARAIRRCGELLREIEAPKFRGIQHTEVRAGTGPDQTHNQACGDAGLSEWQRAMAVTKVVLRFGKTTKASFGTKQSEFGTSTSTAREAEANRRPSEAMTGNQNAASGHYGHFSKIRYRSPNFSAPLLQNAPAGRWVSNARSR